MDRKELLLELEAIKKGRLSPEDLVEKLLVSPYEDLGFAKIDHHRGLRQGTPEVIYGAGKTAEQILAISQELVAKQETNILITRLSSESSDFLSKELPLQYHPDCRIGVVHPVVNPQPLGSIVVASAGTSDIPVCEEAAVTAEVFGNRVLRLYDVGVAGLHRILSKLDVLSEARVIIAVAGMEGALPSVIGGLVRCPVIAVPTSIGYGANLNGLTALLSMLNSCSSGVSVVNIDNGFGAGFLASRINQMEGIK